MMKYSVPYSLHTGKNIKIYSKSENHTFPAYATYYKIGMGCKGMSLCHQTQNCEGLKLFQSKEYFDMLVG